jgi:hypothetical protein
MAGELTVQFRAYFSGRFSCFFYRFVAPEMARFTAYGKANLPSALMGRDIFNTGLAAAVSAPIVLVLQPCGRPKIFSAIVARVSVDMVNTVGQIALR